MLSNCILARNPRVHKRGMTLNSQIKRAVVINRVKFLADMLSINKTDKETVNERLFAIHQEIDQYLFGGDGNLTYVGKVLTMKEKEQENE